jgi:glucose/arabinose dehydrogenase
MGSRKLSRLAGAVFAGILLVPLGVSAASADPDHPEPPEDVVEAPGDVTPTDIGEIDWNDYERVLLSKDTGEPIDLAVLPDNRVLHTARDGVIRLTDPDTGTTHEVADLDVYQNSEDGLQGIALDPNFEENNLVYLVYAPAEMDGNNSIGNPYPTTTPQGSAPNSIDGSDSLEEWEQWLGYNVLARFTFDPATNVFDLDSEEEILRVETQRGQCCHVGADLAWDAEGNLYMSTGDNTPASRARTATRRSTPPRVSTPGSTRVAAPATPTTCAARSFGSPRSTRSRRAPRPDPTPRTRSPRATSSTRTSTTPSSCARRST